MTNLIIKRVRLAEVIDQATVLANEHWEEVGGIAGCPEIKVNIDPIAYKQLEDMNILVSLGLFTSDNCLIGYLTATIGESHQHKGILTAQTDGFFIRPSYRGYKTFKAIITMFKIMESILKNEYNVQYFFMRTNTNKNLRRLADSLDYTEACIEYVKRLK